MGELGWNELGQKIDFSCAVARFQFGRLVSELLGFNSKNVLGAAFFKPSNLGTKKFKLRMTPGYAHTKFEPPSSHRMATIFSYVHHVYFLDIL